MCSACNGHMCLSGSVMQTRHRGVGAQRWGYLRRGVGASNFEPGLCRCEQCAGATCPRCVKECHSASAYNSRHMRCRNETRKQNSTWNTCVAIRNAQPNQLPTCTHTIIVMHCMSSFLRPLSPICCRPALVHEAPGSCAITLSSEPNARGKHNIQVVSHT